MSPTSPPDPESVSLRLLHRQVGSLTARVIELENERAKILQFMAGSISQSGLLCYLLLVNGSLTLEQTMIIAESIKASASVTDLTTEKAAGWVHKRLIEHGQKA